MFLKLVNELQLLFLNEGFKLIKLNDKVYYIEFDELNIAFDIVNIETEIAVDFVVRRGVRDRGFLLKKHPALKHTSKVRLFKSKVNFINSRVLYALIVSEYHAIYEVYRSKGISLYFNNESDELISGAPLKMYFCKLSNFGDCMSPWLANKLTNRPVINVRELASSTGAVAGVGSIVQMITPNHKKIKVWGSGLIQGDHHQRVAKQLKHAELQHVYASRGELTREFFRKYNFSVSNILGDPALLTNKVFSINKNKKYKYGIVPHYVHFGFFNKIKDADICIIDVRKPVKEVVELIASCESIISTSLHGLIVAQSLSIPWGHLYINDSERRLIGELFKFDDFFSMLNVDQVYQEKVNKEDLSLENIQKILNKTYLPKYKNNYSEEGLLDSFYKSIE